MLFSEVTTARKQVESRQARCSNSRSRRQLGPTPGRDDGRRGGCARQPPFGGFPSVTGEIDVTADRVTIGQEYRDGMVAAAIGTLDFSALGAEIIEDLRAGRTLVVPNVISDHRIRERRSPHQATDTRSLILVPLVRQKRLRALLYLAHREPRAWTPGELELVEEVAARCGRLSSRRA